MIPFHQRQPPPVDRRHPTVAEHRTIDFRVRGGRRNDSSGVAIDQHAGSPIGVLIEVEAFDGRGATEHRHPGDDLVGHGEGGHIALEGAAAGGLDDDHALRDPCQRRQRVIGERRDPRLAASRGSYRVDDPAVIAGDIETQHHRTRFERRQTARQVHRIAVEDDDIGSQLGEFGGDMANHACGCIAGDEEHRRCVGDTPGDLVEHCGIEPGEGAFDIRQIDRAGSAPSGLGSSAIIAAEANRRGNRSSDHLGLGGSLQFAISVIAESRRAPHDRGNPDAGGLGDLGDGRERRGRRIGHEHIGDFGLGARQRCPRRRDALDHGGSGIGWNNGAHQRYTNGMSVPVEQLAATDRDHTVAIAPVAIAPVDGARCDWTALTDYLATTHSLEHGEHDDEALALARRAGRRLPDPIADAVLGFADRAPRSGALLIDSLPVGTLPPTPAAPGARASHWMLSELILLSIARLLGQPVGYAPEHGGRIVQDIVPVAATADQQISTSSSCDLMFHTETAFHPFRPRYLLLSCLRGDRRAATTLMSIHDILDQLDEPSIELLYQPRFRLAVDTSFLDGRPGRLGDPVPVLSGTRAEPTFVFDADLMHGTDPEACAVLETVTGIIARQHSSVVLESGDLLIVDNNLAVHGRTSYRPRYDGRDRWLQRTFVVTDLAPSAAERNGRVIATAFGV